MTPPETWIPLPETVDYIARWYAWATNGAPDGEPFQRSGGLYDCAPNKAGADIMFALGKVFPFGQADFFKRRTERTMPFDPNRLAFCRGVLVRAGRMEDL